MQDLANALHQWCQQTHTHPPGIPFPHLEGVFSGPSPPPSAFITCRAPQTVVVDDEVEGRSRKRPRPKSGKGGKNKQRKRPRPESIYVESSDGEDGGNSDDNGDSDDDDNSCSDNGGRKDGRTRGDNGGREEGRTKKRENSCSDDGDRKDGRTKKRPRAEPAQKWQSESKRPREEKHAYGWTQRDDCGAPRTLSAAIVRANNEEAAVCFPMRRFASLPAPGAPPARCVPRVPTVSLRLCGPQPCIDACHLSFLLVPVRLLLSCCLTVVCTICERLTTVPICERLTLYDDFTNVYCHLNNCTVNTPLYPCNVPTSQMQCSSKM